MRVDFHASIGEIPRPAWDRMLPGEPEDWNYYKTIEPVAPAAFRVGAISVSDGGRIVACAPIFRVSYRIDTPLQGVMRSAGQWLFERWPRLVSLPIIGIGSPMSDNCSIAFEPELSKTQRQAVFGAMLGKLEELAEAEKSGLVAVKSIDGLAEDLAPAFAARSYTRVTSVPLVMLDLPFATYEDYLGSLRAKTRGYLKRKARANARVRMEHRSSMEGLEQQIFGLYESTLRNSKVDYGDFEKLTPEYFPRVLAALGDSAQLTLCWHEEVLVGFQLSLVGPKRVVTKHIGMKYPEARELNLYFLNWLKMIEFAIQHRIPVVEMGATTYATKLLFGGRIERRWLYFKFRGNVTNRLLRPLTPLFDFERNDPELRALAKQSRAGAPDGEVA
ncbi:MAG: GNAT family N-acetyltransferase [Hyphomicrobiaceae bacterium]|nr:GNAT family N-acetyltransferase [Hyphomicrobiaceae bacterium]